MAAKFEEGSNTKPPRERSPAEERLKSASSGDTLPPTPLRDLLTAGGANVFVLSVDAELADTVQRAAGEHYPVFVVEQWAELETEIRSGRCGIALLDGDLLGAELARRIGQLDAYAERVVVLVAAQRAKAEGLMTFLSERKIHRLLIKPSAPGITRLLIESAVKRCLQLRELGNASTDFSDRRLPPPRAAKRVPAWAFKAAGLAVLAVVGLAIAFGSWWRAPPADAGAGTQATQRAVVDSGRAQQGSEAERAGPAATPALVETALESPAAAEPRFAALLARAAQAFREGRLSAPPGDNALDYYLTVLAAEPAEPTARRELAAVVDALYSQAETALLAGETETAADALANVRRADPSSGRLQFLEAQLERARSEAAPSPSERAAPAEARAAAAADDAGAEVRAELAANLVAAAQRAIAAGDLEAAEPLAAEARRIGAAAADVARLEAELARGRTAQERQAEWLAAARERLRDDALITPEADSASHYLALLQAEAPTFPGLDAAWRDWRAAVARAAQADLDARRWDAAGVWLAALREAPGGAPAAAPLVEALEFGRRQEQYLATAVPAGEFRLLESVPLVYPEAAERRGQEGWVELDFTIDTTGGVRDVTVTAADPPGRFDEAAVAAVSQYRFAPFEEDGRRYARRAHVRVRFTLQ
jgi:protein TonB